MAISRRLFGTAAQGVVVGVLAVFFNGWELGANHLIESTFIPRMEAYAFCYAGLALLLSRRPILAGLAFAAGGLFQPAVPLQFAAIVALWILIAGDGSRVASFLKFSGAYWIVSLPWMLYLRGAVVGESNLSAEEIIHLFAWIRHPAHMIPSTWTPQRWLASLTLLCAFGAAWPLQRESRPALWRLGWIVPLTVLILGVSTLFIEVFPMRWVVLLQPYRAAVLLYLVLLLILAPLVLELARSGEASKRVRAAALMVSVADPRFLIPGLMLAAVLVLAERRSESISPRLELLLWAVIAFGLAVFYPWLRGPVVLGLIISAGLLLPLGGSFFASARGQRGLLMGVALVAAGLLTAFRTLPIERWMLRGEGGQYNAVDRLLMRYQLNVIPIPAIERLAAWARENTERDALFVIPPERTSWGFRLMARRAQVFDVKSIPYAPPGIEAWWERSLHHRGIFEPEDPANAQRMKEAWNDLNMDGIAEDYANLTADEMARLAALYDAPFVITAATYEDERFELLRVEGAPENPGRSKTMSLYRVVPGDAEDVAHADRAEASAVRQP